MKSGETAYAAEVVWDVSEDVEALCCHWNWDSKKDKCKTFSNPASQMWI